MELINEYNLNRYSKVSGIYAHINEEYKKVYIGKSQDLRMRIKQYLLGNGHTDKINRFVKLDNTKTFIVKTFNSICDLDLSIMEDVYRCEFEAYGYDTINEAETMSDINRRFINDQYSLKDYCYNQNKLYYSKIINTDKAKGFKDIIKETILSSNIVRNDAYNEKCKVLKIVESIRNENDKFKDIELGFLFRNDMLRYDLDNFYGYIGIDISTMSVEGEYEGILFDKYEAGNMIKDRALILELCKEKYTDWDILPKSRKQVRMYGECKRMGLDWNCIFIYEYINDGLVK